MTKEYNWRTDYNWMDTEDHPVDEAVEDCKLIPTLSDKPESPFDDYKTNVIQMMLKTGKRQGEVLSTKIQEGK